MVRPAIPHSAPKVRKPRSSPNSERVAELRKHFTLLNNPRSRSQRSQCLYCNKELSYFPKSLAQHLGRCPRLPEEVVLLPNPSPKAMKQPRPPRKQSDNFPTPGELQEHFLSFFSPEFISERARCVHCGKQQAWIRKQLANHLTKCPRSPNQANNQSQKRTQKHSKKQAKKCYGIKKPAEFQKHFTFFRNRRFRGERSRCLHCGKEQAYVREQLARHLIRCPQFPRKEIRPVVLPYYESSRGNKKPDTDEIRSHFHVFDHPKFQNPRARCKHCSEETSLGRIRLHFAICPRSPENMIQPKVLSRNPFESSSGSLSKVVSSEVSFGTSPKVLERPSPFTEIPSEPSTNKLTSTSPPLVLQELPPKPPFQSTFSEVPPESRSSALSSGSSLSELSSISSISETSSESPSVIGLVKPQRSEFTTLRRYFTFIIDKRFKQPRSRCVYCSHESASNLSSLERHVAKCPKFPEGVDKPTFRTCFLCRRWVSQEEYKAHIKGCGNKCYQCERLVRPQDKKSHRETCNFRRCSGCKKGRIPVLDWDAHRSVMQPEGVLGLP